MTNYNMNQEACGGCIVFMSNMNLGYANLLSVE